MAPSTTRALPNSTLQRHPHRRSLPCREHLDELVKLLAPSARTPSASLDGRPSSTTATSPNSRPKPSGICQLRPGRRSWRPRKSPSSARTHPHALRLLPSTGLLRRFRRHRGRRPYRHRSRLKQSGMFWSCAVPTPSSSPAAVRCPAASRTSGNPSPDLLLFRAPFNEGNRGVIQFLALEEANLLHARRTARRHGWWDSVTSAMQGLDELYGYQGRLSEWSRLVAEITPDYCTPDDAPIPGREDRYSLVMDYRVRLARDHDRDLPQATALQKRCVAWDRQRAASPSVSLPTSRLTPSKAGLSAHSQSRLKPSVTYCESKAAATACSSTEKPSATTSESKTPPLKQGPLQPWHRLQGRSSHPRP